VTQTPNISPSPRWPLAHVLILLALWLTIFLAALSTPPLLDDADATHAQAAQAMLSTGDWVTLHVDGIRYLEKPPLPYWITAASLYLFAPHNRPYASSPSAERRAAFAVHLPLSLTILGLALLGYVWARRAFNPTTALYTALFLLTSAGVFLFTRVFIPDALLSLLLAFALYAMLRALHPSTKLPPSAQHAVILSEALNNQNSVILSEAQSAQPKDPDALHAAPTVNTFLTTPPANDLWPYAVWTALALAVLTKGLVSLVFFFTTALVFLYWTHQLHHWRRLRPFSGILLFLAIAAPWHILAGLRNTAGADGHGFFWFYFINEHVLRFLGRRIPRDYNKLPGYLYWSLHLVWLFPWSLFAPAALLYAWRNRRAIAPTQSTRSSVILSEGAHSPTLSEGAHSPTLSEGAHSPNLSAAVEGPRGTLSSPDPSAIPNSTSREPRPTTTFSHQTIQILLIFSALVLLFFSLSTNQEYYTFPVYLPLLMLLAAALTNIANNPIDETLRRTLTFAFAALTAIGLAIAIALSYGLWSARHLPFIPDIGDLLAHRNVGDYTLSMSHFFDLTGPSFAALRLPATLALIAFLLGPPTAWLLHNRRRSLPAILTIALTSTAFLVAAHIALVRFGPMLSSANFAQTIQSLERTQAISPTNEVLLYGDQAYGSSIPFYLNRHVLLVDGRSTSMLFGSTFPDAPHIFLTPADLLARWGTGPRKLLFVPLEKRDVVDQLLGNRQIILQQTSGKALITDRPIDNQRQQTVPSLSLAQQQQTIPTRFQTRRQSGTPGL
jgi:4-amino-4-deoxy-L-arabinose transferase-like glycosyltransferase